MLNVLVLGGEGLRGVMFEAASPLQRVVMHMREPFGTMAVAKCPVELL